MNQLEILDLVEKHPGLTAKEYAAFTGCTPARTSVLLGKILFKQLVFRTGRWGNFRYWPPEKNTKTPLETQRRIRKLKDLIVETERVIARAQSNRGKYHLMLVELGGERATASEETAAWEAAMGIAVGDRILIHQRPFGCGNDDLVGKEAIVVALGKDEDEGPYATIAVQAEFSDGANPYKMWCFQSIGLPSSTSVETERTREGQP